MKPPTSSENWKKISDDFLKKWNMPNCVGALDGKHIRIRAPSNSGSLYYNYKGFFSVVLLALCDGNYKFTLFDIGAYGSESDSGILFRSEMGKVIYGQTLNILRKSQLPGTNQEERVFFIGDSAFEISDILMKPYPKKDLNTDTRKIFNYRLCRARRTIENAFGILVARWGVLQKAIALNVQDASTVVFTTLVLHNLLLTENGSTYCPDKYVDDETQTGEIIPGDWRHDVTTASTNNTFLDLERTSDPNEMISETARVRRAHEMRSRLADYFVSDEGSVPWQNEYIQRGQFSDNTPDQN